METARCGARSKKGKRGSFSFNTFISLFPVTRCALLENLTFCGQHARNEVKIAFATDLFHGRICWISEPYYGRTAELHLAEPLIPELLEGELIIGDTVCWVLRRRLERLIMLHYSGISGQSPHRHSYKKACRCARWSYRGRESNKLCHKARAGDK